MRKYRILNNIKVKQPNPLFILFIFIFFAYLNYVGLDKGMIETVIVLNSVILIGCSILFIIVLTIRTFYDTKKS